MTYVLLGGIALAALLVLYRLFGKADLRQVARALRWIVGGGAALLALWLLIRGRIDIASIVGAAAFSILRFGRIGPLVFDAGMTSDTNQSEVTSRYIAMTLAHGSGDVTGRVIEGAFKGADLIDLGETDTRQLLAEVAADPDSLALLETWLDKNRSGWREYFAGQDQGQDQSAEAPSADLDQQAYDVLGLKPGATDAEIRVAHRNLMKGVHPDQGGSNYLASKINEAKDRLLRRRRS